MDSFQKKKRLEVFKSITGDLSPEAHHFSKSFPSEFCDYETRKPFVFEHSRDHNYSYISIPYEIFDKFSRNFQSFGDYVCQNQEFPYVHILYRTPESWTKAKNFLKTFEGSESNSFDSSSEYLGNFSNNSPSLNISTEESSREDYEERRKPRKRPLDEGEKSYYVIDIDSVIKGYDRRTTVMIKNIPNKYTQKMLLQTIDKKFVGRYDFLYLPIDFKNRCNVGYAFINFFDCKTIAAFHQEFNFKRWEKFNSEKICELAYGRIQGLPGLIQHFQNSSVINQEDNKVKPVILPRH